jgi:hypothetical protein
MRKYIDGDFWGANDYKEGKLLLWRDDGRLPPSLSRKPAVCLPYQPVNR